MDSQPTPPPVPTSAPSPSPALTPLDPLDVLKAMLDGLGLQTHVDRYKQDDGVLLHIATVEPGRLIGRGGETLNQLQYLLNRILMRHDPNAPRVVVDCERYRERQRDDLIRSVVQAAEKVRRWGDPVRIGPFNPFERRLIHQRMERDPEMEVISEGGESEGSKHMIIRIRETPPAPPDRPSPVPNA
jgi:spoIIIJ-associated protein